MREEVQCADGSVLAAGEDHVVRHRQQVVDGVGVPRVLVTVVAILTLKIRV